MKSVRTHVAIPLTRIAGPPAAAFLRDAFCGFGSLALASLLSQEQAARQQSAGGQAAAAAGRRRSRSSSCSWPAGRATSTRSIPSRCLNQLDGQKKPAEFGEAKYQFVRPNARCWARKRTFRKYGQSGIEVSDLFPHTAQCIDDIAVIRSCYGDKVVHSAAQYELFSGRTVPGFPSMGSWAVYGLGSESESLPGYVVMPDPDGALEAGQPMYMNGFLPAAYQPTLLRPGAQPRAQSRSAAGRVARSAPQDGRADPPAQRSVAAGRRYRSWPPASPLTTWRSRCRPKRRRSSTWPAKRRPRSTCTASARRQTDDYGRRCLLARRLVERGVRFTVVVSGGGPGNKQWDAHSDIEENHLRMAGETDKAVAGLLTDLKQRGLLDSTLVLWGGEFGRSPEAQGGKGRDHHNLGFTMWLAGGGVKRRPVRSAPPTPSASRPSRSRYHLRDIHTTILHLLGFDQNELTYPHLGRDERLTLVEGKVIKEIV